MENLFRKNLAYLKDNNNETYATIGLAAGCSANTVSNWIQKNFDPKMSELEMLSHYFEINLDDLLYSDLQNVHLNEKSETVKNGENVHLNVHPNVHLTGKKEEKEVNKESRLKDDNTAFKDQLLQTQQKLIDNLEERVKYLQNQIDQMKYDVPEREESQHTPRKERKSA